MSIGSIRVLEIGGSLAVAACGQQLARWGADVVTLSANVDALASLEPRVGQVSMTRAWLMMNKRMVDAPASLGNDATVILTDESDEALAAMGLEAGVHTIVHRIEPFSDGAGREHDCAILLEALSGHLYVNGEPDREPLRAPGHMIDYITGASAFGATLAAIHKLIATGEAEAISTSALDVLTTITPFVRSQYTGEADQRHGGPATGVRLYPVGDGMISANLFGRSTFTSFLEAAGVDASKVPEHLDEPKKRYDRQAMLQFLAANTRGKRASVIFEDMMARGLPPIGLFQTIEEVLANRHLAAIGYFGEVEAAGVGRVTIPGLPARFSATASVAPVAMERDMPHWRAAGIRSRANASGGEAPLAGVRILDFTQAWIGPFATMMLADLGADVIKVESHKRVDVWRNWPGNIPASNIRNPRAHAYNTSGNFNSTNRNKREIAIDLSTDEGKAVARDLVKDADIVMDNYTPRVMKNFSLDYESLKVIKPDIISVSWSGYGTMGPYADFKANGTTIEALAGWDALFGYRGGEPLVMGYYQADAITGMQMAACTLLALLHRELTGEGQQVLGSMIEAAIPYIGETVMAGSAGGDCERWGNRHPEYVPHGVFPCAGDDDWVAIACCSDEQWARLAGVIGGTREDETIEGRRAREDEIEAAIGRWTRTLSKGQAASRLNEIGVPAAPVLDSLEVLDHEEFVRRNWFQRQLHEDMGEFFYGGFPWRFFRSTLEARLPPPRLGEHSAAILESLGYDGETIRRLFANDVVGCVLTADEDVRDA